MNRKEATRQHKQSETLQSLGFTADEADKLRRISMTLRRWFELECGTGYHVKNPFYTFATWVDLCVERDGNEDDSPPILRKGMQTPEGYKEWKHRIPDRETGARKRLAKIVSAVNERRTNRHPDIDESWSYSPPLTSYVQTDPRGAALYILRPGDVPEGEDISAYYSRGICVY